VPESDRVTPRTSVIVPARNADRTLPRTLAALAALEPPAEEIILVDNGSTDDTRRRLEAFAATARVLVLHEPRRGASVARNHGARAATGDVDRRRFPGQEGGGAAGAGAALATPAGVAAAVWRLAVVGHDRADPGPRPGRVLARPLGPGRLPPRQGGGDDEWTLVGLAQVRPCLSLRHRQCRC
jgi:Glycosyl transferase family 2